MSDNRGNKGIIEGSVVELKDSINNLYLGKVTNIEQNSSVVCVVWDDEYAPFGMFWDTKFLTLHEEL